MTARAHAPARYQPALALIACAAFAWTPRARAEDQRGPGSGAPQASAPRSLVDEPFSAGDESSERARAAFESGLTYLATQQRSQQDGTFPRDGGTNYVPVPLAALGALALMAGGSTPERGPHSEPVARAIDYLLDHADMNPTAPARGYIASEGDPISRMHGHGFATVALAMAWTESRKSPRGERLGEVLASAVDVIESSQGLEGGWYYEPRRGVEHENSVTVVLLQALRSARNVGIEVDSAGIARAVEYVGRCQTEDGEYHYTLDRTSPSSIALTAAGITTLHAAGRYDVPELMRANTALAQQRARREEKRGALATDKYPHYERLYVALALWTARDTQQFQRWYACELERLLGEQAPDGSWHDADFGDCYATAMNCLVLALPQQLLPLFER